MPSLLDASLSAAERRTLDRFVEALREQLELHAVWLYGSRARGEGAAPESDVDLLVVTSDRERDRRLVHRLLYEIADAERAGPALFSTQVWDPGWLENRRRIDSFFLREIEHDRIVLYEAP